MRVFSIFFLTICTISVYAADNSGNYAIWGHGNKSCHSYNLARADDDSKFKDYIMGYLTAYNHQTPETYSISRDMNLDEVLTALDDQCQLKPVISFEEALVSFIIEHYENRMKLPPGGFGR